MQALTKQEIKKIRKSKTTFVSMIILFTYILIAISLIVLSAYFYTVDSTNKVVEFSGVEAIKEKRKELKKVEGYLDNQKIRDVVNYYKTINDFVVKGIDWKSYDGIMPILNKAFSEPNKLNDNILKNLSVEEAQQVYTMRVKRIEESMNQHVNKKKFTEEDKLHVLQKATELQTPMVYKYFDGWAKLIHNLFFINIFIIILICLCLTNVFTQDINSKMWMIVMASVNGRKKLAYSKIKGSIFISSVIFLLGNIVFFIPLMLFYGFEGWDCSIQIHSGYLMSVYNINFLQAYVIGLIIAYSVCIFMTTLTLLLSNIFKRAIFGIISAMGIFLAPLLVNTDKLGKLLNNFVQIMPISALDVITSLQNNYILNIHGKGVLLLYAKPFILLAIAMIMIPIIVRSYEKLEIL